MTSKVEGKADKNSKSELHYINNDTRKDKSQYVADGFSKISNNCYEC